MTDFADEEKWQYVCCAWHNQLSLHTEFQQRISSVSGVSLAKEIFTGNSTTFLAIIDANSIGAEGRDLKTSFQCNQILYFFVNSKFNIFNMNLASVSIMVWLNCLSISCEIEELTSSYCKTACLCNKHEQYGTNET